MSAVPEVQPVRVVLVDDTADLRELLRFALEQHEFTVVAEASDGREGIARVEQHAPDLVLLDLAMPVMDGFEALPRMRRTCPRAKIVVLSGFDAGAMATRAHDLGADGYLQKGASLNETLRYLREVVGPPGTTLPLAPQAVAPLTVVPDPAPRASPRLGAPGLPAWLDAVPFGVLRLDDSPDLVVLEANAAATTVLGVGVRTGAPLATTSAALAARVAPYAAADTTRLELSSGVAAPLHVTLVRDGEERVLVLTPHG